MIPPEEIEMLRQVLAARAEGREPSPDCLDDDTVAALAEGSLDALLRERAVAHLATCAHCRLAVASVARALGDRAVARATGGGGGRWRRLVRIALPAAAAALVLLVLWPRPANDGGQHRAPGKDATAPLPIAPVGAVARADALRWTMVPGADRYRVTLYDARGAVLYETQVGDTTATLPDSVSVVPGRSYLWKVEARTGWDRWSASTLVEFSAPVAAPP